jgi:hypothetical protein
MSPTRRQLLAGFTAFVATGSVAGAIASDDSVVAPVHQHSNGQYQESRATRDPFAWIEPPTIMLGRYVDRRSPEETAAYLIEHGHDPADALRFLEWVERTCNALSQTVRA